MDMATSSAHRSVTVERTSHGMFTVANSRGGQITFGTGSDADFTPTELPAGEHGDAARGVLPGVVKKSHDRLCTVGRTIEIGTPIATRIE
jgi:uncharacterized OsmC-like protein